MSAKSRSVQLVEVVEVKTAAGKGTEDNPCRIVTEYWSKDGVLLAVSDPEVTAPEHRTFLDQ